MWSHAGTELLKSFSTPVNILRLLIYGLWAASWLNSLADNPYSLEKTFWIKFNVLFQCLEHLLHKI